MYSGDGGSADDRCQAVSLYQHPVVSEAPQSVFPGADMLTVAQWAAARLAVAGRRLGPDQALCRARQERSASLGAATVLRHAGARRLRGGSTAAGELLCSNWKYSRAWHVRALSLCVCFLLWYRQVYSQMKSTVERLSWVEQYFPSTVADKIAGGEGGKLIGQIS